MLTNCINKTLFLVMLGVGAFIVVACSSEEGIAPAVLTPNVALEDTKIPENQPEPSPAATQEITVDVITIPADNLIVNDDPWRAATFNINTLAYELPGMDDVEVVNYTYAFHEEEPLTLDIYYPPEFQPESQLPVVIFGMGYRMSSGSLRNAHFYTSWGRMVAAAGMVGIIYDTEQPDQDLEILMGFIKKNADALRIDSNQIGIMSSSANVPTVMSYLMQGKKGAIKFAIYYYGLSLTSDDIYRDGFTDLCSSRGCLYGELVNASYVDPDLPLLIVEAGQDFIPNINEAMDHFVDYVREGGASVTLIVYEEGKHGFDTEQKTKKESAEIIAQTIEFMRTKFGIE